MIPVRLDCGHLRWVSVKRWLDCRGMRTWHLRCPEHGTERIARTAWPTWKRPQ